MLTDLPLGEKKSDTANTDPEPENGV